MDAYTVSDRGTWLSFKNKASLAVLIEGDARLINRYDVICPTRKNIQYRSRPRAASRNGSFRRRGRLQSVHMRLLVSSHSILLPRLQSERQVGDFLTGS
jgi:ABC-type tungstate transport system permease subunit